MLMFLNFSFISCFCFCSDVSFPSCSLRCLSWLSPLFWYLCLFLLLPVLFEGSFAPRLTFLLVITLSVRSPPLWMYLSPRAPFVSCHSSDILTFLSCLFLPFDSWLCWVPVTHLVIMIYIYIIIIYNIAFIHPVSGPNAALRVCWQPSPQISHVSWSHFGLYLSKTNLIGDIKTICSPLHD